MWDDNLDDPSELLLADAVFNQTSKVDFMVRKAEPADVPQIVKLIDNETRRIFPSCDAGKILEKSVFSLVLTDAAKLSSIMAHASFSDVPLDKNVNIDGKLWKTHDDLKSINSMNGLFLVFFVWSSEVLPDVALQEVIGNAFLTCTLVDYIILEMPDVNYAGI
ncbi:unnamed protein product [Allacma fusca]|uniref:Cilia- and flagella-associated protein 61 N-terminal domain-containing protein n=1 Tax=Allacma fusca TaxID=39272 RepID=A0A8J2K5Z8_9HEXA|nr:unnamed protein product [Allacma fusca]